LLALTVPRLRAAFQRAATARSTLSMNEAKAASP
jgi:hypothetical protein